MERGQGKDHIQRRSFIRMKNKEIRIETKRASRSCRMTRIEKTRSDLGDMFDFYGKIK
jgi:hypothetical protein